MCLVLAHVGDVSELLLAAVRVGVSSLSCCGLVLASLVLSAALVLFADLLCLSVWAALLAVARLLLCIRYPHAFLAGVLWLSPLARLTFLPGFVGCRFCLSSRVVLPPTRRLVSRLLFPLA